VEEIAKRLPNSPAGRRNCLRVRLPKEEDAVALVTLLADETLQWDLDAQGHTAMHFAAAQDASGAKQSNVQRRGRRRRTANAF
jgi:hypothetical protein